MKRYISIALCALTVFGLGSCNKIHEEDFDNAVRSVTFQAQLGNDTRTGLALKFVPDWRQTNLSDVHIWEVTDSERIEGEDITMDIPGADKGDYEIALFEADFSNMTIIVNPPDNAPATRAGETYVYTSIVASKDNSGKYTVPSTQYPGAETLIDPHADFLVGLSPVDFSQSQAGKQVDIRFTRPVAISRLSIMNIQGTTIRQVKIYSSDKLTGSATYENVNFQDATVAFDNSGSDVITMDYGSGVAMPAEGVFNAYFVSLVGTKRITKVEVITNAGTESKSFDGGKALTFKVPDFKSIAVNMGTSVTPGPGEDQPQNISFVKGGSNIAADTFDLYTGGTYVSPTVTGAATGATLTYSSSDPAVATVSATGVVTPKVAGETVISVTASKVTGYQAGYAEYTLTVTDSTPEPQDQPLKFMKGGAEVTSDSFDLKNGASTYVSPTLTGAVDGATVTWAIECLTEGCATLAADGKVTPVAPGVAIITATASAVAPLYNETTKSYTLEITDTTPSTTADYLLVSEVEDVVEGTYLIVSADGEKVFDGSGTYQGGYTTIANSSAITMDGDKISISGDQSAYEFSFAKSGNGFTITGAKGMIVAAAHSGASTSQETYITFAATGGSVFLQRGKLTSDDKALLFSTTRGSSSEEYLYFNTNNSIFKIGGSGSTRGIHLYKFDDGTPKPVFQPLKFMKGGEEITSDTFDLNGGGVYETPALTGVAEGATVTWELTCIPDGCATVDADGKVTPVAVGTVVVSATASAVSPLYKETSKSYDLEIKDTTPTAATTYTVVTKEEDVVNGNYLIVAADDDKVFDGSGTYQGGYATISNTAAITLDGNNITISGDKSAYEFAFAKSGNGFTITGAKGMIVAAAHSGASTSQETYITFAETGGSVFLQRGKLSTDDKALLFSTTRGSSSEEYIYFNTNNSIFKIGGSGSTRGFHLYAASRAAQTLAYSEAAVSYDMAAGSFVAPTLSGDYHTALTYASSKESVATIDANGAVTIKGTGTTTITATAPASAEYFSASASYELTVTNSSSQQGPVYNKVTAASELEAGAQYLIVFEGLEGDSDDGDPKVFKPVLSSDGTQFEKAVSSALDVTITDGTIESSEFDDCLFTLENGYYLKSDKAGRYIYPGASGSSSVPLAEATPSHALTITFEDGHALIKYDTRYIVWSTYSHYFSVNTSFSSTSYATYICLYRLDDGRQKQTLTFSGAEAKYDLATSDWTVAVPSLSGAMTSPLSWTSSDEAVATVDGTGKVTPVAKGTATITVTAPADATYRSGSASFTVTVFNSNVPKYVKAEEVEAGEQYLIVSNGYALKNNNSSTAGAEAVEVVGGEILYDAPASVLWTAAESSGKFTFKNDTRYLVRSSSNVQLNTSNPTSWSYDAANEHLTTAGSSSTYYFYYSTGNSRFSTSSTQSDTHVAALYKLDDGKPKEQKLAFSEEAVSFNMATSTDFVEPTLSGAKTTVSYASNATGVATVDTNSGEVTIQGAGEATITATAVATDKYLEGTASYKITVINKTQYYVKVNSRDELPGTTETSATGDYIFVYEDGSKAHVFKAICNEAPTGNGSSSSGHVELEKTGSAIEVDLTSNGILATDEVAACKLQLAHHSTASRNDWNLKPASLGTYWVRVYNNGTNVRILAMTSAGYSATYTFEGTGNNLEIKRTDSSRDAYWSYNATSDCFEGTATASKISIYKLSE